MTQQCSRGMCHLFEKSSFYFKSFSWYKNVSDIIILWSQNLVQYLFLTRPLTSQYDPIHSDSVYLMYQVSRLSTMLLFLNNYQNNLSVLVSLIYFSIDQNFKIAITTTYANRFILITFVYIFNLEWLWIKARRVQLEWCTIFIAS